MPEIEGKTEPKKTRGPQNSYAVFKRLEDNNLECLSVNHKDVKECVDAIKNDPESVGVKDGDEVVIASVRKKFKVKIAMKKEISIE